MVWCSHSPSLTFGAPSPTHGSAWPPSWYVSNLASWFQICPIHLRCAYPAIAVLVPIEVPSQPEVLRNQWGPPDFWAGAAAECKLSAFGLGPSRILFSHLLEMFQHRGMGGLQNMFG